MTLTETACGRPCHSQPPVLLLFVFWQTSPLQKYLIYSNIEAENVHVYYNTCGCSIRSRTIRHSCLTSMHFEIRAQFAQNNVPLYKTTNWLYTAYCCNDKPACSESSYHGGQWATERSTERSTHHESASFTEIVDQTSPTLMCRSLFIVRSLFTAAEDIWSARLCTQ